MSCIERGCARHNLTLLQATASSQNAAGANTQRKSVSMRPADASAGPRYKSPSATTSHGFPCLLAVCHVVVWQGARLTMVAVQFLDESSEVRSQYTDDSSYPFGSHDNSPRPGSSKSGPSPDVTTPPFPVLTPTDGFSVLSLLNSDSPGQPRSHGTAPTSQAEDAQLDSFQQAESNTFVYQQPPGQPILWPLEHEQEAMLLQHYIENVALFVSDAPC
jgi:hypothetical protein